MGKNCPIETEHARRQNFQRNQERLEIDIRDVTLWLREKSKRPSLQIWIERRFSQRGKGIASITVFFAPRAPDTLSPAARDAFLALGYDIHHSSGAGTYGYPLCDYEHSHHDILRAYARVESALALWRAS